MITTEATIALSVQESVLFIGDNLRVFGIIFIIVALLMGGIVLDNGTNEGRASQVVKICLPESYISVNALYEYCHVPGKCGKHLECEGQTALVRGSIDYSNVFEHSLYPQLPYEKFFLAGDNGKILDVMAVSSDNALIFSKIFAARKEGKISVFIKGTIRGFDSSIMGLCLREMMLEINSHEDVSFR